VSTNLVLRRPHGSKGVPISISLDRYWHCKTTDAGLVFHMACLFTPQLSLIVFCSYTHGGMARLSWPGWLVT